MFNLDHYIQLSTSTVPLDIESKTRFSGLRLALAFAGDRSTQTTLHHRESSLSRAYTQATRDLESLRAKYATAKIPNKPNTPPTRESA